MGRYDLCDSEIGTSFEAKRWLSFDPCGIFCLFLSVSLHIFSLVEVSNRLISDNLAAKIIFGTLYVPFFLMAMASLVVAWTSDPGAVPMGARPVSTQADDEEVTRNSTGPTFERGIRRCHKCDDNYKPPRAHHDSVTGRCIVKMDHYCPWVCNAVGIYNHKFFFLFIFYTFLTSCTAMTLLLMGIFRCGYTIEIQGYNTPQEAQAPNITTLYLDDYENDYDDDDENTYQTMEMEMTRTQGFIDQKESDDTNYNNLSLECQEVLTPEVMVLFVISVAFFIFTLCMLIEQYEAIRNNTSKIARMKMRAGMAGDELGRVASNLNEIFGGDSPNIQWHWLLPTKVWFPENMKDAILGYEWDPSYGHKIFEPMKENNGPRSGLSDGPLLPVMEEDSEPTLAEGEAVPGTSLMEEHDGLNNETSGGVKLQHHVEEKVSLLKHD